MNNNCIDRSTVCDFQNDCSDGTDEEKTVCLGYTDRCNFESGFCDWVQGERDEANWTVVSAVSLLLHVWLFVNEAELSMGLKVFLQFLATSQLTFRGSSTSQLKNSHYKIKKL